MDERVSELVRDAIKTASEVVHTETESAKREAQRAAAASAVSTSIAGAGVMAAVFGTGLLLAAPVIPRSASRLRRRMLVASLVYLGGGIAAAAWGALAVQTILSDTASDTAQNIRQTGEAFTEAFEEAQHH